MWKQKLDAEGKPVVDANGLPIFIKADGSETAFDAEKQFENVGRLMGESRTHREAAEAATAKVQQFEGVDITAAKKALETVKAFDGKTAIAAGELERQRAEAAATVEEKYKPLVEKQTLLETQLQNVTVGNAFSNSKFIAEKIAEHVPRDMVQATFGRNFEMKDGQIVAKHNGNPVYSPADPSKLATFDEALEVMVNSYANKAQILKGIGAGGSGSGGGGGIPGLLNGKTQIKRTAFEALGGAEQMAALKTSVVVD